MGHMQPKYYFHQVLLRNIPYLGILKDEEVKGVSFITVVEINFHLHFTRAQTNKTTHKQTQ